MADSALSNGNGRVHRKSKSTAFAAGSVVLADQLRRDVPGQQTDNRLEQSQHYRGVIYIAIRALMDALLSSTIQINRKHRRYHATSLRRLEKALPTPHANTQDEQFRPFDDPDHSLVKLVDQPNRSETFNEILAQMAMQYMLTGSALLWANPGERIPVPRELYVLPTALCYAQPPQPNYPEGWWRVTQFYPAGGYGILPSPIAGGGAPVDGRDIFRFKNPHPLWRWDAYSPLSGGGVQLDILESIDQARWTAMDMGLTPDMVVLAPGVAQAQLDTHLERLKHTNIGKRNFRKVMAIGGDQGDSKFDVKFPSTTAKDMDFSGGWDQMTAFALALFGVPKSVAGLATTGSYAELYAALKQFHTLTLRPLVARLGVWFTRHLARIWGDDLAIQIDLPTIDDQQLQEQQLSTDLAHDGLTYNEYRALRGRDPVPGGNVLCSVYVQQQQAKAQQQQQAQNPQPAPAAPGQPGGDAFQPADAGAQPSSPNGPDQNASAAPAGAPNAQQTQGAVPPDQNADQLSSLLGTPTPGGDDGHVQNSVADAALNALGVPQQGPAEPPTGTPTTVGKSYAAQYEKATNPNRPVGVPRPKKVGAPTGTPPNKPANVPAASDSHSKAEESNRDPGDVYPAPSGAVRQQTPSDTSAPAPAPKATPNAATPNPPPPPTAKRIADANGITPTKPGGAAPQPYKSPTAAQPAEPTAQPVQPTAAPTASPAPQPRTAPPPTAERVPEAVAQAGPTQSRQEGERFKGPMGHWFEMRGNQPVPIATPTSGSAVQGSPTANVRLKPAAVQNWFGALSQNQQADVVKWVNDTRRGKDRDRPPVDPHEHVILDQLAREVRQTGKLPAYIEKRARQLYPPPAEPSPLAAMFSEQKPPKPDIFAPVEPVAPAAVQNEARRNAANAALGKNAPPPPITDHASLIRAMSNHPDYAAFGKTPEERAGTLERMNEQSVRQLARASGLPLPPEGTKATAGAAGVIPVVRPVAPKEQIAALANADQFPPAEAFAPHAATVPADTPAAKAVLANAGSWVAPLAAQHAQKVADHFGIDLPRATKLLAHAISAIAQHAAQKGNPNNPTAAVTIAGAPGTLTASAGINPLTVRMHPRTIAARQIVSDMVEHMRGGHDLTDAQASEMAGKGGAIDHLPPDEIKAHANTIVRNRVRTEAREDDRTVAFAKKTAAAMLAAGMGGSPALAEQANAAPATGSPVPAIVAPAPPRPDMRNPLAPPATARTLAQQPPPPNVPPSAGAPPEPKPEPPTLAVPRQPGEEAEAAPDHSAGNEHLDRLRRRRQDAENAGKDTAAIDRHIARVTDAIRAAGGVGVHNPDVTETGEHGITKAARVGVPANEVPDKISPLPNLTPRERHAEQRFREAYEKNPDKMADDFLKIAHKIGADKGGPPEFGTDDAKLLAKQWQSPELEQNKEQRAKNRATLNLALHATANAIAKRAFVKHLDTLKPGDQVMVTVGGVAAGKGWAIKKVPQVKSLKDQSKAVWDSAGDQSATENPWIQQELEKRGLKGVYVYVHADPYRQWADPKRGVVQRAGDPEDGRMVDAHVFADSYAIGAQNHQKFAEANKNNPNAKFVFLDNNDVPKEIPGVPESDLKIDRDDLLRHSLKKLRESDAPDHVKHGGSLGSRIWEPPPPPPTPRDARNLREPKPAAPASEVSSGSADRRFRAALKTAPPKPYGDIDAAARPPSSSELENGGLGAHLHPNVQVRTVNGKKWVVKGRNGKRAAVENEATASGLARSIGLNVPQVHAVKMHGQDAAAVEHVEGTPLVRMTPDERRGALAKVPKADIDRHALFDYLAGNSDPNNGNYMVTPDNKLAAIDKEQTLSHGAIRRLAHYRIPFFLEDAGPTPGKAAGDYAFHPQALAEMAQHGREMAKKLRADGHAMDAGGVERRTAVLDKLAKVGGPVTASELNDAGHAHDNTSPPPNALARVRNVLGAAWQAFRGR